MRDNVSVTVSKSGRVRSIVAPRLGPRPYQGKLTERQIHPLVLERAMALAGGDIRRLFVDADGSITVANRARRG